MKISGFTMVKNATKLYYPIKASITSILPIVDEFVVALGNCDEDDNTLSEIESINSHKIKIIHTKWDLNKYPNGTENAHQTDIAKGACSGDWLFYLQADEVVHEKDLPLIQEKCQKHLNNEQVEGFLFKYYHFWGDYQHYHNSHGWYKNEIRIIRNKKDIHSWKSAQSFRRIPNFDGINYRQKENTFKLKVVKLDAHIYHYGWVRPPRLMKKKNKALDTIHKGAKTANQIHDNEAQYFNYGNLSKINKFNCAHPKVMKEEIEKFNWKNDLDYTGEKMLNRPMFKHEKTKYRIISKIENFFGVSFGGTKNFIAVKD